MEIVEKVQRRGDRALDAPAVAWRGGKCALPHLPGGRIPDSLAAVVAQSHGLRQGAALRQRRRLAGRHRGLPERLRHQRRAGRPWQATRPAHQAHKGIFATAAAAWLLITALGVWFVINLRAKEQRAVAGEQNAKAPKPWRCGKRKPPASRLRRAGLNLAEAAQREGNGAGDAGRAQRCARRLARRHLALSARAVRHFHRPHPHRCRGDRRRGRDTRGGPASSRSRIEAGKSRHESAHRGSGCWSFSWDLPTRKEGTAIASRSVRTADISPQDAPAACGIPLARRLGASPDQDDAKEREWVTPPTERLEFGRNDALLRQGSRSLQVWNPVTGQLWWRKRSPAISASKAPSLLAATRWSSSRTRIACSW